MNRAILFAAVALFVAGACRKPPTEETRCRAALELTAVYARSNMAAWGIEARPAGDDFGVLMIHIRSGDVTIQDVEAMHWGSGVSRPVAGGVNRFRRDHGFRGVIYVDSSNDTFISGDPRRRTTTDDRAAWYDPGVSELSPRDADMLAGRMAVATCTSEL